MNLFVVLGTLAVLGLGAIWLLRRLILPDAVTDCEPSWLEDFSIAKYRPMLRLLADEDYEFLAFQAGQTPATIRKLRSERRRIFRAYLRSLTADFHRLHLAGKMLLVYSAVARPELANRLIEQRVTFTLALLKVHYHLLLHTVGIGSVDVQAVLGCVESLRIQVASAQPSLA